MNFTVEFKEPSFEANDGLVLLNLNKILLQKCDHKFILLIYYSGKTQLM